MAGGFGSSHVVLPSIPPAPKPQMPFQLPAPLHQQQEIPASIDDAASGGAKLMPLDPLEEIELQNLRNFAPLELGQLHLRAGP
ncbi:unnamed protein product [Vitrella brassicaformis CCMP3155]|uniref:Uncharacterized protein n=1 Tax=Vitrella brassicaformis (strain CCMP3155) TaxID=1169540 RepID=A0A0G4GZD6_VITBC|nr:unnamed protein product [Vitrella brassicaformis CCMP3155]|eukprot:CEM36604.1 unnamed protein product [Vitrella brassicaformis CCMP3155]